MSAARTDLDLERMRLLWEGSPDLSAADIGERFGVSKNIVIGHATRGRWKARRDSTRPPSTLFQRLDELHRQFDAKLVDR